MQSKFKIGQTVFWTKNKHWYVVEANLSPAFVALIELGFQTEARTPLLFGAHASVDAILFHVL